MHAPDPTNGLETEKTDAEAGAVFKAALYLLLATTVVAVGLIYLTKGLVSLEVQGDPPRAPLTEAAGRLPPEPRLQTLPFVDIEAQHQEEDNTLTTYGWVDPKAGTVRIPIEEAMSILAVRGLPLAGGATPETRPAKGETR